MKLTAFLAALLLGTTAQAQSASATASTSSGWTFALHGFTSMSTGYQTGAFTASEGQQSIAAALANNYGLTDRGSWTADVRQSRFNFSVAGPKVFNGLATPKGVLEIDFFQGFGGSNYGDVSLLNRLRLVYSELDFGPAARLAFGQMNDLTFALVPTSLSHIAWPLAYFTGGIGWRRPGLWGFHTFAVAPETKMEFAWEIGRAQWDDLSNGVAPTGIGGGASAHPGGINLGEASGGPAFEGRVSLEYSRYLRAFVASHWNRIDTNGYANLTTRAPATNPKATEDVFAVNGGLKLELPMPNDMLFTIQGSGFSGQNLAPLIGNIALAGFKFGPNGESVRSQGYWAQAGFNLTKQFSLWGMYGQQFVDKTDVARAFGVDNPYQNDMTNVIAMYRDGGWGFSAEWIDFSTKYAKVVSGNTITKSQTAHADQYLLSANYFF